MGEPEPAAETDDLDYRFTLANERTFLAWVRTALGLLAGGVAVHTLVDPDALPRFHRIITLLCLALALMVAGGAYRHWQRTDRAMRRGDALPGTALVPVLTIGVTIVAVLAAVPVLWQ